MGTLWDDKSDIHPCPTCALFMAHDWDKCRRAEQERLFDLAVAGESFSDADDDA